MKIAISISGPMAGGKSVAAAAIERALRSAGFIDIRTEGVALSARLLPQIKLAAAQARGTVKIIETRE